MKALTTFKGIKKGQRFKVIGNYSGANYPIGSVFTMSKDGVATTTMNNIAIEFPGGNSIYAKDIQLFGSSLIELRSELKVVLSEKDTIVKELKRKIKFCEDNELEDYDSEVEKVYQVLNTLNSKSTNMEKALLISKLIKE